MSQINIAGLTFAYDGSYDNIFENVSFRIDTDWKLGFTGRNGRGKTTFLNLLLGKYEYRGKISSSVIFQYFPYQVTDKTAKTGKVVDEICRNFEEWKLMRELSLLDVSEDVLNRPFETLSNGEQTKILLAALFLSENNFLLIDEPTNHLDASGRKTVSNYLNGKSGYILVSHDRAFLDGCVDHILSINRANIEVQRGNFSSWYANKERRDNFELAENEKLKKDIKRLKQAAKQSENWADK
ncbi:MAG: ATP-binding cassette domain-containing protein, partial [Clostridiales bacterium]|nr:ATP-binding cassette domain-containing protein [Clostridiales bacterium]